MAEVQLNEHKANVERNRRTALESLKIAKDTFENVSKHIEEWEVRKINETTYNISGPGLGIPDEGSWTYYMDSGEIKPADKEAQALKRVLSGQG